MAKDSPKPVAIVLDDNFQAPNMPKYPRWLHHDYLDSILVNDEAEKKAAIKNGYTEIAAPMTANRCLSNWFWDIEDMSKKQLIVYARDEYGVDLPADAQHKTLFRAVLELGRSAPQNKNRLVLMAHTIKMNYDETIEEIKRVMAGQADGYEMETITQEVIL